MSTTKHRDRGKERFWRTMVRQWRRSGLSVRAFCEEQRLSEPSFYAWRRILRERDSEAVRFLPVQVTPEPQTSAAADAAAGRLELVLSGGWRLRIGSDFDTVTLQRLLAVLREARP